MSTNIISKAIYNDSIFTSSELNRRSGYVLDTALEKPVTITRNNDSFALVERKLMASMAMGIEQMKTISQILNIILRINLGQKIEKANEYKWLEEFDLDERVELVDEVYEALNLAQSTNDWEEVAAIIHEWRESAIALSSDELDKAFSEDS